jgi:hypothetical protein
VRNVVFRRFTGMVLGMQRMRMRSVGMMGRLLVVTGGMMPSGFLVMFGGVLVMLRSLQMVFMSWMVSSFRAIFSSVLVFCRLL